MDFPARRNTPLHNSMTEEEKTAISLVDFLGYSEALAHIDFVLSPAFRLYKIELRRFWLEVQMIIYREQDYANALENAQKGREGTICYNLL